MRSLMFFACILACMYFSSTTDIRPQLRQAVASSSFENVLACLDAVGLTRATFPKVFFGEEEVVNGVHLQPEMEERRNKTGCFLACILQKQDMLDETGLKEQNIHSVISTGVDESNAPKIHQIAHKCIGQVKNLTLPCEICLELVVCGWKEIHKVYGHEDHKITAEHEDHERHEKHEEREEHTEHEDHEGHEKHEEREEHA